MDQPHHLSTSNKRVCLRSRRQWSDLPELVLDAIVVKLGSPFAFFAFAGVCRSWRSVAKSTKLEFMASQPPLLLTLPLSPSGTPSFHLYCLTDRMSYSAKSPALASLLRNFSILGHHHGYLIALDERTKAPTIVSLCTDVTYSFPSCPCACERGLLTSPPDSGDCMLILYRESCHTERIWYCRVGEPSTIWHSVRLPKFVWSAAVHENMLYFSSIGGQVMVLDIGRHGDSLNLVRVIEPPFDKLAFSTLTVFEEELVMIPGIMNGRKSNVLRLELRYGGGEGRWTEGLGVGRSVFLSACGETRRGYVWRGRTKGVEDKCVYRALRGCRWPILKTTKGGMIERVGSLRDTRGNGVWVPPSNLEQWGFKNM